MINKLNELCAELFFNVHLIQFNTSLSPRRVMFAETALTW